MNLCEARPTTGIPILNRLHQKTWMFVAALCFFAEARAFAQPAPTPEEVQQAQVRWNEGKAYFDAGNFEAARVAFKQAYTVFPHAAFLQNLGEAELRTGRNVEAARHFTAFLRASSAGSPAQRELAKKSLTKAAERLGSVIVTTNVDDAEIRVDDEVVGRSPLGSLAWYVEPGRHTITARKDGFLDGSERVDIAIGQPRTVLVRVQRVVGGTSEAPPEEPKLANAQINGSLPPARVANEPHVTRDAVSTEPRYTPWPVRTLVLLTGAALTVGAGAVGAAYAIRTNADATRVGNGDATLAKIAAERSTPHWTVAPSQVCHMSQGTELSDFCTGYNADVQQHHEDRRIRDLALVGAGVLGVATVATFFIWRPRQTSAVSLSPAFSPTAPGMVLFGNF